MAYMLDTNMCIYIIKRKPARVIERLTKTPLADVCISAATLSELEYGVEKSLHRQQNRFALTEFLAPFEIMPYDDLAAARYGAIRSELERSGRTIGPLDMLIAAHALALRAIIVSNNDAEFKRVPGLMVENWAT